MESKIESCLEGYFLISVEKLKEVMDKVFMFHFGHLSHGAVIQAKQDFHNELQALTVSPQATPAVEPTTPETPAQA